MSKDIANQLYLAYLGRPSDMGWRTSTANLLNGAAPSVALQNAFFTASVLEGVYSLNDSNATLVNKIFLNIFGFGATTFEQTAWGDLIAKGTITAQTAAWTIFASYLGATNVPDVYKTPTQSKLVALDAYTTALESNAAANAALSQLGSSASNTARTYLTGVTSVETAATAVSGVSTTIAAASTSSVTGPTFTLSANADTLDPASATASLKTTTGDDTFRAPTDGFLTSADFIDAGAGTDTLTASITANSQTIAPVLKNLELITLTVAAANEKTLVFNALEATSATSITIKDAGAISNNASDERISVTNMAKTTTLGLVGGTESTGDTASDIAATFSGAAAGDTQKVAISSLGKVGTLTLSTAETVEIAATGTGTTGGNAIGKLAATAVKTLNIKGSGDLTISASDLAATVSVNASTATGKITFTGETAATSTTFTGGSGATSFTSASTGAIIVTTGAAADTVDVSGSANTATISTGAGNDTVKVGASSNITAADVIAGGEGTDTITVSDATINATTKTNLALGVSGFEVVATTAVAEVTIDFEALNAYDVVTVATASTPSDAPGAGVTGGAAIAATMESSGDQLIVSAARTGQAGNAAAATGGNDVSTAGGAGVSVAPKLDGGANVATIKFVGNADITGGAGGVSAGGAAGDTGGNGGAGLTAANIETLNIDISGTKAAGTGVVGDVVTFTGGAAGGAGTSGTAGTAGSTVVVGTNATINLTSSLTGSTAAVHNDVDLGAVVGNNVTINGAAFKGAITATATGGNVALLGGEGKDKLTGGDGKDTVSGGAGSDTLDGAAGADVYTGGAGRDSFAVSNSGTGTGAFDTIADFGKVTSALTAAQVQTISKTNGFGAAAASATSLGGAETDGLLFAATATFRAATTSINVGAVVTGVTADISAKGLVSVGGANAAQVDTLAEWVSVANLAATTNGNVALFEFSGSTYAFQQSDDTDSLVQLIGVTGVTGGVVIGSNVAAAVGDIFVA